MTLPTRPADISGIRFPPQQQAPGVYGNAVVNFRPPQFEPPPGSREFIVSFSVNAPALLTTPIFQLDGAGTIVVPSAAIQLAQGQQARISGVSIGGDTNVGAPVLTFSLARTKDGQQKIPGWEGVGLPGRGGYVAIGLEPFTFIEEQGSFFGGFVTNSDVAPHLAEMILQGWMW
jgi:hypothetical protein